MIRKTKMIINLAKDNSIIASILNSRASNHKETEKENYLLQLHQGGSKARAKRKGPRIIIGLNITRLQIKRVNRWDSKKTGELSTEVSMKKDFKLGQNLMETEKKLLLMPS